jgi:hypothetical protein
VDRGLSYTLLLMVELQLGSNDFSFKVIGEATVLEQPNGDTHPLLVLLRRVTVKSSHGPEGKLLLNDAHWYQRSRAESRASGGG